MGVVGTNFGAAASLALAWTSLRGKKLWHGDDLDKVVWTDDSLSEAFPRPHWISWRVRRSWGREEEGSDERHADAVPRGSSTVPKGGFAHRELHICMQFPHKFAHIWGKLRRNFQMHNLGGKTQNGTKNLKKPGEKIKTDGTNRVGLAPPKFHHELGKITRRTIHLPHPY